MPNRNRNTDRRVITRKADHRPEVTSTAILEVLFVTSVESERHVYAIRLHLTVDCCSGAATSVSAILDPVGEIHE